MNKIGAFFTHKHQQLLKWIDVHPQINKAVHVATRTIQGFGEEDVPRMAASMSYWLLVTVAPLLLFIVSVFSFLGQTPLGSLVPNVDIAAFAPGSLNVADVIGGAVKFAGPFASIASIVMLFWGALSMFRQLVWALDVIWKTPPSEKQTRKFLRFNGLSALFFFVLFIVLILAFALTSLYSQLSGVFNQFLSKNFHVELSWLDGIAPFVIGVVVATLFFAVVFWIIPRKRTRIKDIVIASLATSFFYTAGQLIFTTIITDSHRYNVYGAFSIFVAIIVWIFYSSIIVLGGAILTREVTIARECEYGKIDVHTKGD